MFKRLTKMFTPRDALWERYKQEASKKALFTPDVSELQQLETVNIFVYDSVQSNQPHNSLLSGTHKYRGVGYTKSSDFVLFKKLLGNETFPFALEIAEDQRMGLSSLIGDPGQIMGEIYTVSPVDVIALDNHMLNTVQYNRKRVKILIPFKIDPATDEFSVQEIEPFMWVGDSEFWLDQLSASDSKKLFKQSNRLFNLKKNNSHEILSDEPLSAYYTFDHNIEAGKE